MYENQDQELQNKIIALYVLGCLDIPVTDQSLNELILSTGLVNYFSFRDALGELVKNGSVAPFADNDGYALYEITDQGRAELGTLKEMLSPVLKNAYDDVLRREKDRIVRETTVNAYPFIDINKNQSVRCYIREKGNKVVDIRLPVPDQDTADTICENWKKDAYSILSKIILIASE
ncbi:MAG: DUF4364 family protein [Clostridia bacterium]|jgi:hypothetical protein|nr:DUF4364 family protein [Clostridia bacterium]MBO7503639.1 DUF4364 family protein [Clostridia bacterium]MBO7658242.1 DUF4364 family protein [Clostridia bacterium]MBP5665665.1 DUF4364 family protein [Clostridia bacterium]MBP5766847.1 DUF4364 family protein [Clostridia bacterium]